MPVIGSAGRNGWHDTARAPGPGVTVGRSGASAGVVTFVPEPFWPHNTVLFVTDFKGNDPRFVAYMLRQLPLAEMNSGAAQPSLNRNFLYPLPVRVPEPTSQRRIASILSAYDDLIEVNRRRIALLEEMARRLFEEWFVHFRFPVQGSGEATDIEACPLPAGWRREPLASVAEPIGNTITPGATPDRRFLHYSFPAFDAGHLPTEEDGGAILSNKLAFAAPAVLVGKLNPRIPRIWYVPQTLSLPQIASTEFVPLRPRDRMTVSVLYAYAQSTGFADRLRALTQGTSTSHQRARPQDVMRIPIAVPPDNLLAKAEDQLAPLYRLAHELREAKARLAASRDLLLPRLISGELAVAAAERELEAAA